MVRLRKEHIQFICETIDTGSVKVLENIQNLWSGYGQILRLETDREQIPSVIIKFIDLTRKSGDESRSISHKRKLRSYKIETEWYKNYSSKCDESSRVPFCYSSYRAKDQILILLEDLDAKGFSKRVSSADWQCARTCISWLANFHAIFLNLKPEGLWSTGTYWHLATRPDELKALTDLRLKDAAGKIDFRLSHCKYKTIVHGDAKLANFCFSADRKKVAAVDFQYVGGGCGMKDLAYFVGSMFGEEQCEALEEDILALYFEEFKKALAKRSISIDFAELEAEWRELYAFAWADFHRFLKGWSPGHWKINSYSEKLVRLVVERI